MAPTNEPRKYGLGTVIAACALVVTVLGLVGGIFWNSMSVANTAGRSLERLQNVEKQVGAMSVDLRAHLNQFSGEQVRIGILERDVNALEVRVDKLERTTSAEGKR